MMNAGNKRLILLLLALSMLVCGVIGGTLALNDTPDEMKYDVNVLCYNTEEGKYNLPLWGANAYKPFSDVLWCPGYTKIVYLKVINNEAFAVKYSLDLVVESTEFGQTMEYAVIHSDLKAPNATHPTSWTEFAGNNSSVLSKGTYPLLPAPTKTIETTDSTTIETNLAAGAFEYVALAIHMDEDANNDYKNKQMKLNFKLVVEAETGPDNQ